MLDGSRPWLDPGFTSLHRLPIRPWTVPCPDLRTARRHDPAASPWWRSLDGTWDFTMLAGPEHLRPEHLAADTACDTTIEVPGAWTLQGHGHPHYTNVIMPFPGEPPSVPADNPTGVYRRTVSIPRDWRGRRTVLRVGAAESMVFAYLDGTLVGASTDSRLAAEFDLTAHVRPGRRHTLVLVVPKWSAGTWLEDQDQWWHGGLQRPVSLYSTASSHLAEVRLVPGLAEVPTAARRSAPVTGTLDIAVGCHGPLRAEAGWTVEVRVETLRGAQVASTGALALPRWEDESELHELIAGMLTDPGVVRCTLEVPGVDMWSAESPSLYRAAVILADPSGSVVEVQALKVGFRSVEVRDRELLVNGAPVVIRGVNVHEHDPEHGRWVPPELARRDLEMIKAANLNAVRAAHYPHDEQFAALCDELGLYLVDEANVETHARQWSLCHDPRWFAAIVERVERMARRDVHHPSVILWSLGNESGYGAPHDAAAAFLRRFDASRPIQYEGPFMHDVFAAAPVSDVVCPMYSTPEEILHWAATTADTRRPLILCEYSHAMGNACGSLQEYDDIFETVEGIQGGFIWEWLEHGIALDPHGDPRGAPVWGYGGDFGDHPNDAGFILDGLVGADRNPHPGLEEVRWLGRPVRSSLVRSTGRSATVRVANRRWFTDTADLVGRWELAADGEVRAEGGVELDPLGPRRERNVTVRWPADAAVPGAEHTLTLRWRRRSGTSWAPRGTEMAWDQFELPLGTPAAPPAAPAASAAPVGDNPTWDLALGFVPSVFRALTDNDGIRTGWMAGANGPFPRWIGALGLDRCSWDPATGELRPGGAGLDPVLVDSTAVDLGGGWVALTVEFRVPDVLADPPRLGLCWELPGDWERLEWFGDGPQESYPDRRGAATLGRWRSTVWDQYVGYGMPQEHGHHGGLRWAAVAGADDGLLVVAVDPGRPGFSVRHHGDAELWAARHTSDLAGAGDAPPTWLSVDVAQRGLGQSSLGFEAREEFRIGAGVHTLPLLLRRYRPGRERPATLYAARPRPG